MATTCGGGAEVRSSGCSCGERYSTVSLCSSGLSVCSTCFETFFLPQSTQVHSTPPAVSCTDSQWWFR